MFIDALWHIVRSSISLSEARNTHIIDLVELRLGAYEDILILVDSLLQHIILRLRPLAHLDHPSFRLVPPPINTCQCGILNKNDVPLV